MEGAVARHSRVNGPHEAAMDFNSPTALRARVLALEETVLLLAGVMASYPQTRRDLEIRFAELAAHAEASGASAAGKISMRRSPSRWRSCSRSRV